MNSLKLSKKISKIRSWNHTKYEQNAIHYLNSKQTNLADVTDSFLAISFTKQLLDQYDEAIFLPFRNVSGSI
jgi:hypothetical protein